MQDVVLVRRDHQPADRQAHLLGDIACEYVAEIAGGHGKADLAVRRAQHVVDGNSEIAQLEVQLPRTFQLLDRCQHLGIFHI